MTKKTIDFSSGKPQKMKGWHSWRHRTDEANSAAREEYQWNRGRAARQRRAQERAASAPAASGGAS